jgi:hypothetical protein|tara:strand:+ start:1805 stop:2095 length:291 start_codon:yes stop_codon:yes gene_type:complete
MKVKLINSPNPEKKFRAVFETGGHVDFGGKGYSDFTIHKDPTRMKRYLARHGRMGETWSKNGIKTAGFWSRWLLWSKPSMKEAKTLMSKKFGIRFI